MATLRITEYAKLGRSGVQVGEEPANANQSVTYTTSTQSSAFASTTEFVRLIADADVYLVFGSDPTATATGTLLPADTIEYFGVSPGHKVAAYDGSS